MEGKEWNKKKEEMRIVLTEIVLSILCWKWKLCVALVGKYFTFGARGKFKRKVLALGIASVLSLLKKRKKLDHRRRTKLTRTIWAGLGG